MGSGTDVGRIAAPERDRNDDRHGARGDLIRNLVVVTFSQDSAAVTIRDDSEGVVAQVGVAVAQNVGFVSTSGSTGGTFNGVRERQVWWGQL